MPIRLSEEMFNLLVFCNPYDFLYIEQHLSRKNKSRDKCSAFHLISAVYHAKIFYAEHVEIRDNHQVDIRGGN